MFSTSNAIKRPCFIFCSTFSTCVLIKAIQQINLTNPPICIHLWYTNPSFTFLFPLSSTLSFDTFSSLSSSFILLCAFIAKGNSRETGVSYRIECPDECSYEYTGQTGLNAYTR